VPIDAVAAGNRSSAANQHTTVNVVPGDVSTQTIAIFANRYEPLPPFDWENETWRP
jgi:hypothetical protein